jgi:hypothetical protein
MGSSGEIKNAVLNLHMEGFTSAINEWSPFVLRNNGTIRDIRVNVWGGDELWHRNMSFLCHYNRGTIENFAMCFKTPVYARATFGGVVGSYNYNTIRNGYVYGEPIVVPSLTSSGDPPVASYIGGIVAENTLSGLIENVYSLVDIEIGDTVAPSAADIGTIVGANSGTVRNAYSAGQVYFSDSISGSVPDPAGSGRYMYYGAGPGVGNHGGKQRTAVQYYSGDDEATGVYTRSYNTRVMSETLRREEWHANVLGAGFDSANTVPIGYYPHVKTSGVMPPQDYIPLPGSTASEIEIVSAVTEKQREAYAVVALTLKNPYYYAIRGLTVENMGSAIVLGPRVTQGDLNDLGLGLTLTELGDRTQIDSDGLSRVFVLLSKPVKYFSRYPIKEFTASIGAANPIVNHYMPPNGGFPVDAEFFYPIDDMSDWALLAAEAGKPAGEQQNYRLKTDLDFAGRSSGNIRVGTTVTSRTESTQKFEGKFDGGVYDDEMELIGVHSLSNMLVDPENDATVGNNQQQGGGVFAFVTGTISNLLVRDLTINAPQNTYVGFVRVLYGGGRIENVRLENIDYTGQGESASAGTSSRMGGLAAVQYYGEIEDSSVKNATLRSSAKNISAGGLTGELYAADMRNCWISGLDMSISSGIMAGGFGGVAGVVENSKLYNLYAQGRIETSDQNAGGIIGVYRSNTLFQNTWNKVDISSMTDRLGGVAGAGNGTTVINSLSLGNLSSAAARFEGTSAGDNLHRIVGTGILYSGSGGAAQYGGVAVRTQRINGAVPIGSDSGIAADDATLLYVGSGEEEADAYDLKNPRTYTHNILMGAAFDYSRVHEGVLPKLFSRSSGRLLDGQDDILMEDSGAEVLRVVAYGDDAADVYVQHETGAVIEGIRVSHWPEGTYTAVFVTDPDLVGLDATLPGMSVTKAELVFTGEPERCVDTYAISTVRVDGSDVPVTGEINFPIARYWEISDEGEWQEKMALHGQTFENFRVTGDVDFSRLPVAEKVLSSVSVNRLVGAEGVIPVISRYIGSGADASLIQTVAAELGGLSFEDIRITPPADVAGIIGKLQGKATDLAFRRIEITNAAGNRSYVGCIGNIIANVYNIILEDISVFGYGTAGSLAGYGGASEFANIKAERVSVFGTTGNNVGGVVGYAASSKFSDCEVTDVYVKGGGTNVGGLAGNAYTNTGQTVSLSARCKVTNAVVIGAGSTGGMFGYGQINNRVSGEMSSVNNAFVRSSGAYTGGLVGTVDSWYNYRAELTDSYVLGTSYTGGYDGTGGQYMSRFYMRNSVVSTINYAGDGVDTGYAVWLARFKARNAGNVWLLAAANNIPGISVSATVYNYIGGLHGGGAGVLEGVVIAHSFIGGNANYVGGVLGGVSGRNQVMMTVIGSTVVGKNRVGGIAGYLNSGTIRYAAVNANVNGEDEVGGITGGMSQNRTLYGTIVAYIRSTYFVGNVTATVGRAAGVAGNVPESLIATTDRYSIANLVAADIDAPQAAFFYNRASGDDSPLQRHVVFGDSKLNGTTPPAQDGVNIVDAAHIYGVADLQDVNKWKSTSLLGDGFNTTGSGRYFQYGGLKVTSPAPNGYMPYMTNAWADGGGAVLAPYQNGRTSDSPGIYTYNPMPAIRSDILLDPAPLGGIPIPDGGPIILPMSMMSMALTPQVLPRASVYAAGGASGLNIEFDAANPKTYFVVKAAGLTLNEEPIEARVYTLDYDFVTPLTVEVTDGHTTETYDVEPYSLRRSVMLYEDDYYYTDGLGLRAGSGALLPGGFINLRDGRGLTADGLLYDAATGDPLGTIAVPASLRKEASPLNAFTYGDYRIEAYLNFSVTAADGGKGGVTTKRLLGANGSMTAADPDVSAVYDSLIYDARDGEEYLSVLDAYGRIADTRAAIKKPEDFKNAGIAHFANNLNSELPYMLVRYENGLIDGFNYLTGEPLAFESKGDLSLLEYAEDYFSSDNIEPLSEAARGYMNLKPLQRALSVFGLKELLSGIEDEAARISEEEDGDANGNGSGDAPGGADERTELKPGTDEPAPEEAGTPVTPLGDVRADGSGRAVNATGLGNGTATAVGAGAGDRLGDGGAGTPDPAATGPDADGFANIAAETGTEDADADEEIPDTNDGANETGAELGTEPGDTEAEAAESATINGAAANIAQGANANRGGTQALAVPERPERRSYTLVYDAAAGKYVFCDTESLLETGRIEPVLTATAEAETAALAMLAEAEAREIAPENPLLGGGMKVLIALFVVSFLLLYAGALRQRRSSR